jgi:PAS domain-containing protein
MLIDMKEHGQAEERQEENETTIHGLVEQSLVGVFIVDEVGKLVYVNPRFAQTLGMRSRRTSSADR